MLTCRLWNRCANQHVTWHHSRLSLLMTTLYWSTVKIIILHFGVTVVCIHCHLHDHVYFHRHEEPNYYTSTEVKKDGELLHGGEDTYSTVYDSLRHHHSRHVRPTLYCTFLSSTWTLCVYFRLLDHEKCAEQYKSPLSINHANYSKSFSHNHVVFKNHCSIRIIVP